MKRVAASVLSGYLVGAIPVADTVARLARPGFDLRGAGTGNPGAVNAIHLLGWGWGWAILVGDTLKGVAACDLGARMAGPAGAHSAGTAAVIGHCFPVWRRFRGGKGVAVSLGQCLATFPAYLPFDLGVAWAVGKWRGRSFPGTLAGCITWVAAGLLWWWRGWPNAWGPKPGPGLPLSAAASSAVILYRFAASPVPR